MGEGAVPLPLVVEVISFPRERWCVFAGKAGFQRKAVIFRPADPRAVLIVQLLQRPAGKVT